jgi:acyl-CoA thioesterase FadM
MPSIVLPCRIRWADADAARRLHFPRIFEYFEDGEAELWRSLNLPLGGQRGYDLPRVHVECEFRKVLPLYAPFWLRVSIGKVGRTSIRYDYQGFADENCQELALAGTMTVVFVQNGKAVEIPAELRAILS